MSEKRRLSGRVVLDDVQSERDRQSVPSHPQFSDMIVKSQVLQNVCPFSFIRRLLREYSDLLDPLFVV